MIVGLTSEASSKVIPTLKKKCSKGVRLTWKQVISGLTEQPLLNEDKAASPLPGAEYCRERLLLIFSLGNTPGNALQHGEDANDSVLYLNRLLGQYLGDIRVQSSNAIAWPCLGYGSRLGG